MRDAGWGSRGSGYSRQAVTSLHPEMRVFHHEGPDVVAGAVHREVSLESDEFDWHPSASSRLGNFGSSRYDNMMVHLVMGSWVMGDG